jgi:hypothetical protein
MSSSWIYRNNIVNMLVQSKAIYYAVPTKIPVTLFTEIDKSFLKFIWIHKRFQITKNPEQKKQCLVLFIHHFKVYYNAILTKTAWYCHKTYT